MVQFLTILVALVTIATCSSAHSHIPGTTNEHPYCVEQRRTNMGICKLERNRDDEISCEKVHQILCRDDNFLLRLGCLQAAITLCLRSGNWGTPAFESCKKYYDAECPLNNLPAPLKCVSVQGRYYGICKASKNAPILWPCEKYVKKVCPPVHEAPTLECAVLCNKRCQTGRFGDVKKCQENCAVLCKPHASH